jgi:hypothetical protein
LRRSSAAPETCGVACRHAVREEQKVLHGLLKWLRRNGHQLITGCCEQLSSNRHSMEAEPINAAPVACMCANM